MNILIAVFMFISGEISNFREFEIQKIRNRKTLVISTITTKIISVEAARTWVYLRVAAIKK